RALPVVAEYEKNQLGFRGQRIEYGPGDLVVVLLGDSQAEAVFCCPFEAMPERRLEEYLARPVGRPVKVFTLGATGYGQDQQLLVLQEYYARYRADLVLLWETPVNDVWNNLFPTHWPANGAPKPTFWVERGTLEGPSEQMGESIATSPIAAVTLWKRALSPLRRDEAWEKRLPPAYAPMTHYEGPVNLLWQVQFNLGVYRDENLRTEKSHLAVRLIPPSPRMHYALDLMRRLLQEIARTVSDHQGTFITFRAVTPEDMQDDTTEVYELNGLYYMASQRQVDANMAYVNQDVQYHKIRVTPEKYRVSPSDPHLNIEATDLVMRDLAAVLRESVPDLRAP
ncbi:MAG TPA: hypothetical protein VEU07_13015, partial [Candidatus Acidoferrum sp.]|nr:hypothetical protein [Candidatus Acidoferrum sp.]